MVTRHKDGHYILVMGTIYQKDVTVINIQASNIGDSKYIKKLLTDVKGEIDGNTIIVGDFNTLLNQWIAHAERKLRRKEWS